MTSRSVSREFFGVSAVPWGSLALPVTGATRGTVSVVASATPHTKGNWVQTTAATTARTSGVYLWVTASSYTNTTDTRTLFDIGVGAAASEVVVVANIGMGGTSVVLGGSQGRAVFVPIVIPAGSRVALRSQSAVVSKSISVLMTPVYGSVGGSTTCTTYAADTATSGGVDLTGGNGVKSSWSELSASTAADINALTISLQTGATASNVNWNLDIGVGAAASEVVVAQDFPCATFTSPAVDFPFTTVPLLAPIPAGSRLAVRGAASAAGAHVFVHVHGFSN